MTAAEVYLVQATPELERDVKALRAAAKADPARHLHLYREVLRVIDELRDGLTDGHHALGYESGKGDLRDCVTAYVQANPQAKPTHRLVFREIGPAEAGQREARAPGTGAVLVKSMATTGPTGGRGGTGWPERLR